MAFSTSDALWQEFLQAWPLERLRTMSLSDYTAAGDKETFTYWMESRLDEYGSIWGGSAFKFGIYSRNDTTEKKGDSSLAYDIVKVNNTCVWPENPSSGCEKIVIVPSTVITNKTCISWPNGTYPEWCIVDVTCKNGRNVRSFIIFLRNAT